METFSRNKVLTYSIAVDSTYLGQWDEPDLRGFLALDWLFSPIQYNDGEAVFATCSGAPLSRQDNLPASGDSLFSESSLLNAFPDQPPCFIRFPRHK